jgi:hypothetical protein
MPAKWWVTVPLDTPAARAISRTLVAGRPFARITDRAASRMSSRRRSAGRRRTTSASSGIRLSVPDGGPGSRTTV